MRRGTRLLLCCALSFSSYGFGQDDARDLYYQAREHLLEDRLERALVLLQRVVSEFPESEEADDAQYYVGYAFEQLGRDEEAIDAFSELLVRWPDSLRVDRARSRRAELLAHRRGGTEDPELFREIFEGSSSWELKRDTAFALARSGNLSAADVLEEAMEREGTSRQIELVRILAGQASSPAARRILIAGLDPSRSTSVQLRALEALAPVAAEGEVATALERLFSSGASTRVQQEAVRALAPQLGDPRAREAVRAALASGNSTSVQMLACEALAGYLVTAEIRPAVIRLFQESTSTSVLLKCLESLERDASDLAAAEILREAIAHPSTSTSVKMQAIQIAASAPSAAVRDVARAGLAPGNATSVQLRAIEAISRGENEEPAASALAELFRQEGISTSVHLAALDALSRHMETRAGPQALARALAPGKSTSVQLKAMHLAAAYVGHPEVKAAVADLLEQSSTSTSVQLEAIGLLSSQVSDLEVRRVLSAALRPSNSTSVVLKAVDALAARTVESDVRLALAGTLEPDYSTSVVLNAMAALAGHVGRDTEVRDAFIRVMESDRISATARVRAGESLLAVADQGLRARIADAMEDVIVRAGRGGHGHGDLIEDALAVLEKIDPARAARLRDRYGLDRRGSTSIASTPSLSPWPFYPAPVY